MSFSYWHGTYDRDGDEPTLYNTVDMESAYSAGVAAERERLESGLRQLILLIKDLADHIEESHIPNQHNPYFVRELWPELFARVDAALNTESEAEK